MMGLFTSRSKIPDVIEHCYIVENYIKTEVSVDYAIAEEKAGRIIRYMTNLDVWNEYHHYYKVTPS